MGMPKKLIVIMAGLSLGACSSTGEKNTFMTYQDLQDKVAAHEEQWQAVQPTLARIDKLEAEVAALKQDRATQDSPNAMSKDMTNNNLITDESMAAVNVAPAVMPAPIEGQGDESASMNTGTEANIQMDKAAPPVVAAPVSTPPTTSQQDYGVQLAAYGNRDEAIRGWNVLIKNHPTSFDGLVPLVNQKDVNGRTMYQLKVGPFLNKSFSSDFCKMLKEKGKDCLVTQYNGEAFTSN